MINDQRPYAVFDIDGTLVRWQLYHALCDILATKKLIKPSDYKTIIESRNMWRNRQAIGSFEQYENNLVKLMDRSLAGLDFDLFFKACQQVCDQHKTQVYAYTRNLIQELKDKGYLIFALSASPVELVANIAKYYGFNDFAGSKRTIINNKLTMDNHLLLGSNKTTKLIELINKHHALQENSIGVGDTMNDSQFLKYVQTPIAFNPNIELFNYAKTKGWKIVVERKNVIYNLEKNNNGQYLLADTI